MGFLKKSTIQFSEHHLSRDSNPCVRVLIGFLDSYAHSEHKFVYTNHKDGWFFSPYEASTLEKALRGFGQFLEGFYSTGNSEI